MKHLLRITLAVFCALALPSIAAAATLSLVPSSNSVGVGGTVTVSVYVASTGQAMNGSSVHLAFPPDKLEAVSVSKTSSILTIWAAEPTFSNSDGTISFEGVLPNPGYTGASGRLATITFKAKSVGVAAISFAEASVLANDGEGTNILTGSPSRSITIVPGTVPVEEPVSGGSAGGTLGGIPILSPTHPDQNAWYSLSDARFEWQSPKNATAVKLGYGENSAGLPQVTYQPAINTRTLTLADGITYFSLQARTPDGWGEVSRYKVQIDTVPPEPFAVEVLRGTTEGGIPARIQFATSDALSGLDRYEVFLNGTKTLTYTSDGKGVVAEMPPVPAGTTTVEVIAYDRAGNTSSAKGEFISVVPPAKPNFFGLIMDFLRQWGWLILNYLTLLLLLLCLIVGIIFAAWYVLHRSHTYRRRLLRRLAETDRVLHAEFMDLREAIADELKALAEARTRRELTAEEERLIKRLNRLLDRSESTLERELISIAKRR
jgi:hypothetical protein